jgi:hypothetical protein
MRLVAKPKSEPKVKLDERGQIVITLDADYTLRPSVEAIMEAERETGLSLFDLASLSANSRMRLDQQAATVAALMHAHGKANPDDPLRTSYVGATAEVLAPMIMEAGTAHVQSGLTIVLTGALTGGYTATGEPKAATGKK